MKAIFQTGEERFFAYVEQIFGIVTVFIEDSKTEKIHSEVMLDSVTFQMIETFVENKITELSKM